MPGCFTAKGTARLLQQVSVLSYSRRVVPEQPAATQQDRLEAQGFESALSCVTGCKEHADIQMLRKQR
jgi:hypothetical protein